MCDALVREDGDSLAFHPGYYVRELMESHGLEAADLADALRMPETELADVACGRAGMTVDLAARLSIAFGTSIWYWLNLQAAYDEKTGRTGADGA